MTGKRLSVDTGGQESSFVSDDYAPRWDDWGNPMNDDAESIENKPEQNVDKSTEHGVE